MIHFCTGGERSESGWHIALCVIGLTTYHNCVGDIVNMLLLLLELTTETGLSEYDCIFHIILYVIKISTASNMYYDDVC